MASAARPRPDIPLWVHAVLWLGVAMPVVFGTLGYFSPGTLFASTWRAYAAPGSLDLTGPLGFYLARNLAMLVATLFALRARSVPMFQMVLLMRVVAETMDGVHYWIGGGAIGPTLAPLVIALVELAALLRIRTLAH